MPVDFNIGGDDHPALITYSPISQQTIVSDEAKVLIKKQMVLLAFVYTGRGPQKGLLIHNWRKWHAHSGMYDEDDKPEDARVAAENAMKKVVKQYSDQFFTHGVCTDVKEFCVVDGKTATKKDAEKQIINIAPWAIVQVEAEGWDGEFKIPGDALCFKHLSMAMQYSSRVNQFSRDDFRKLLAAWEQAMDQLGHMTE